MNHSLFRKSFFLAFILIAASLVAWGCSSTASPTPPLQITISTYTNPNSRYGVELKLMDGGVYNTSSPNTLIPIQGTYVVTGDQVVFTETKDGHCLDIPGTYEWAFDGELLTFTVVEDQCSLRRIALESDPWTKQP